MSETQNPNPTAADQRRAVLREFLNQKTHEVHIEGSPPIQSAESARIVGANADGTLKHTPAADEINFRIYPDGTFCKFTEVKDRPGFLAICLNTAKPEDPDVLQQVGIVKSRAVADLLCDGFNCLMQLKMAEQQQQMATQVEPSQ